MVAFPPPFGATEHLFLSCNLFCTLKPSCHGRDDWAHTLSCQRWAACLFHSSENMHAPGRERAERTKKKDGFTEWLSSWEHVEGTSAPQRWHKSVDFDLLLEEISPLMQHWQYSSRSALMRSASFPPWNPSSHVKRAPVLSESWARKGESPLSPP